MKTPLILSLSLLLLLPAGMAAQETVQQDAEMAQEAPSAHPLRFGYASYKAILSQMTEYAQAKKDFEALKAKYDAEATRSEEEFQRKFAEFIQGQKDFPASIMQKRQAELQELMEKSISFRQQSRELLRKAEADMQAPARQRLNKAIAEVGTEHHLLFVLNTDGEALPFVHPDFGIDVTTLILTQLGIPQQ